MTFQRLRSISNCVYRHVKCNHQFIFWSATRIFSLRGHIHTDIEFGFDFEDKILCRQPKGVRSKCDRSLGSQQRW